MATRGRRILAVASKGRAQVAFGTLLVLGALTFLEADGRGPGSGVALAGGAAGAQEYYVTTTGPTIDVGSAAGDAGQGAAECDEGDVAVGGGWIIHPSSTSDVVITKSIPGNATKDPPFTDGALRAWFVKALRAAGGPGEAAKLDVFVRCADFPPLHPAG